LKKIRYSRAVLIQSCRPCNLAPGEAANGPYKYWCEKRRGNGKRDVAKIRGDKGPRGRNRQKIIITNRKGRKNEKKPLPAVREGTELSGKTQRRGKEKRGARGGKPHNDHLTREAFCAGKTREEKGNGDGNSGRGFQEE